MRTATRAAGPAALAALLATLPAGCGYTFGSGLPAAGVRTVALQVAGNDTARQRLEAELSAALARHLPVASDLVLASRARADAVLEVTVTDVRERTLVPGDRQAPVREGALAAAVRMRLVRRDGTVLLDQALLDRTEFRGPVGEDLSSARAELVDDLARKIALALQTGF